MTCHKGRMSAIAARVGLAVLAVVVMGACHPRPATAAPAAAESAGGGGGGGGDWRSPGWTLEYARGGGVKVRHRHTDVIRVEPHFWGKDYSYEAESVEEPNPQTASPSFKMSVPSLGVKISAKVRRSSPRELTFDMVVETRKSLAGVVGGGLEFHLNLDRAVAGARAAEPELLRGNRGWRWAVTPGQALTVQFSKPIARVYFEQDQKHQIRCFLVGPETRPGTTKLSMKVTLPAGGQVVPHLDQRYGAERGDWRPDTVVWDRWPIDLSHLNAGDRPAGKRGPVRADGDRLVFADGSPARFWGTNVQAYALFSASDEAIKHQAKRLAALGYNLVRLHHHDSEWVSPNVFESDGGTTRRLRREALDRIDKWVQCLTDEGIYVWLDLHVGRLFLPGDGIPAGEEIKGSDQAKGFTFVNPRIETLMQEFAASYLGRKNAYTGRTYAGDPSVLAVLVTNENDLNTHFAARMFPDGGNPAHQKMFEAAVADTARRLGLTQVQPAETWAPGPGKLVQVTMEAEFYDRAIRHLRQVGVRNLVAAGNYWGDQPLYALPPLARGDVIDVHSYGEPEHLSINPRYATNYLHWVAGAQVAGKPLTVSEWSVEHNRRDRFTGPLLFAAVAALQGWDAPMQYGYHQQSLEKPSEAGDYSASYDAGLLAMMPAAALIFREGHVQPAKKTYHLKPSKDELFFKDRSPRNSAAIRTLTEQSRIAVVLPDAPELPWDGGRAPATPGAIVVTDLDKDFIPAGQNHVTSDTGELMHDWGLGYHTIATPRTQAAAGWIGGRTITLSGLELRIATPKAAVAVSALDGQPLASSAKILVTAVAQVRTRKGDSLPYVAEPVRGELRLKTGGAGFQVTAVSPAGQAMGGARVNAEGGAVRFAIPEGNTHWYVLTR
jgi:hypothetical protein